MAKIFKFPDRDEWSDVDQTIAGKMQAEGFGEEAIQTVCQRFRAYREKYVSFDFDFDVDMLGCSPEAVQKVKETFLEFQAQFTQFVNAILMERLSTEIALLQLD